MARVPVSAIAYTARGASCDCFPAAIRDDCRALRPGLGLLHEFDADQRTRAVQA